MVPSNGNPLGKGYQHYFDHFMYGDARLQILRDDERRLACDSLEITLIGIPYWWQRDKDSIIALLHIQRPDIMPHSNNVTPFMYGPEKRQTHTKLVNYAK